MNNEIGRKITSLTLMAIMVAGGLTFAVPGMMPAAHAANANLFVSAENSQFDNYMSGPQVIEVVVIDSDINYTDEAKGEPDVTVNGKFLRMVQAVDGNWYGYFADRDQAQIADSVVALGGNGTGIDFGDFCTAGSAGTSILGDANGFTDTVGVAVPAEEVGQTGASAGGAIVTNCNYVNVGTNGTNNVVREAKTVNSNANVDLGQIGLNGEETGASDLTNDLQGLWPFIQLYDLNPTGNVVVQYNKGGGVQSTTLTFDTVESYADISMDRSVYPRGAQVHVTITDLWLNIDPTDEDSWTFGGNPANATTFYQAFDENGATDGDESDSGDVTAVLGDLMCEDNCVLLFTPDEQGVDVLTIQDNDDSEISLTSTTDPDTARTGAIAVGDRPITITEQGPNSGVFGSYDESDTSALIVIDNAQRGKSATIDYNESPITVLVGFDFATIDIQPVDDEWSSGEEIPVVIVDGDANKNSRADEDLDVNDPAVSLIPTLTTGDPFTLGEAGNPTYQFVTFNTKPQLTEIAAGTSVYRLNDGTFGGNSTDGNSETLSTQTFSERGIFDGATADADARTMVIDLGTTAEELKASMGDTSNAASGTDAKLYGANLINIDLRSFNSTNSWSVSLLNSSNTILDSRDQIGNAGAVTAIPLVNGSNSLALTNMNGTTAIDAGTYDEVITTIFDMDDDDNIALLIVGETGPFSFGTSEAIVVDIFSFGYTDDGVQAGERVANQIIRIEAEETGDNTSTFEGSLEYTMVNQINIQDVSTFEIGPIADDPGFIVIEDLTDEDAPRVSYDDLGADGVVTPVSDQEEDPSHSGVVSLNQDSYKIADTVIVTLEDSDLNVDSDLIDIFAVVGQGTGNTEDMVGSATTRTLSFGELGRLLDITFDDVQWETPDVNTCTVDGEDDNSSSLEDVTSDTGLGATGFTLVETGSETGVFTGDFQIPAFWCRNADTSTLADEQSYETTTGLDIEVNYVDFRDASGEIVEVGDSTGVRANTGSVSLDRTVTQYHSVVPVTLLALTLNPQMVDHYSQFTQVD